MLHEAFGRLTPDDNAPPVKRDTIYPLSSLTKPITATAAMLLVEDGLLGLQRPVSEYLPEFSGEGKQAVMVHHLLTHTSGLREQDVNAHAAKKRGVVAIPPPEETQHPWINEDLFLGYALVEATRRRDVLLQPAIPGERQDPVTTTPSGLPFRKPPCENPLHTETIGGLRIRGCHV